MPKKAKGSKSSTSWQPATRPASSDGEVYRNFFAVRDGIDPRVSLCSMKEMFSGKVDPDVVTMIFTECAYDVDQTLETLMSISSEKNCSASTSDHARSSIDCLDDIKVDENSNMSAECSNIRPKSVQEDPIENPISNASCNLASKLTSDHSFLPMKNIASISTPVQTATTCGELPSIKKYPPPYYVKSFQTSFVQNRSISSDRNVALGTFNARSFSQVTTQFFTPVVNLHSSRAVDKLHSSGGLASGNPVKVAKNTSNIHNKDNSNVNDISSKIIDGKLILVLLRGLPGSGKSTLAKEIKFSGVVFSTDDYFCKNGKYCFDFRKLSDAHNWNRMRTKNALGRKVTPVIVDNTNTEAWEMLPYVKLSIDFQYEVHILEPNNPWKFKPWKLARKNSHNVSKETIDRMLFRYDHSVTVESLKSMLKSGDSEPREEKNSSEKQKPTKGTTILKDSIDSLDSFSEVFEDSNRVSLEAVVHRENDDDDSSSCSPLNDDYNSSNQDSSQETNDKTDNDKVACQERIEDLSELKLLAQNEDEDQSPASSHELPAWETIMEHDDDFSWSATVGNTSSVDLADWKETDNRSWASNTPELNWSTCATPSFFEETDIKTTVIPPPDNFEIVAGPSKNLLPTETTSTCDATILKTDLPIIESPLTTCTKLTEETNADNKKGPSTEKQITTETSIINQRASKPRQSIFEISMNFSESKTFDWELPNFKNEAIIDYHITDSKSKTLTSDSQTQTEPSDFILLHKILNNPLYISETNILMSRPISHSSQCLSASRELEDTEIPLIPCFHKSTSTQDTSESLRCHQLESLQQCFPEIHEEDLRQLLDLCHGDGTWLSNILLEWGYKYNVPAECLLPEQDLTQSVMDSSVVFPCLENNDFASPNDIIVNKLDSHLDSNFGLELESERQRFCLMNFEESTQNLEIETNKEPFQFSTTDDVLKEGLLFNLVLNPALLSYLQERFGPISKCHSENLPDDLRTIPVDGSFGRILYNHWKDAFKTAGGKLLSEDSFEEQSNSVTKHEPIQPEKPVEYLTSDLKERILKGPREPLSLSEIMDMEYALQLSREETLKKQSNSKEYASVKLKRLELHRMFPGVDPTALDEVFESNNFSLKNTLKALEADIGKPAKLTANEENVNEKKIVGHWVDEGNEYLEEHEATASGSRNKSFGPYLTPEAHHWRTEAVMHYQMRQECIRKAQSAYCRGMKSVASCYAQEGDVHAMKFKTANSTAAKLIFQEKNKNPDSRTLDLHGLYIQEAIPILSKFLRRHKEKLGMSTSLETVTIITGRGTHSLSGAPKLRPSVMKYLKNNGHRFDEAKMGIFNVTLSSDPQPIS